MEPLCRQDHFAGARVDQRQAGRLAFGKVGGLAVTAQLELGTLADDTGPVLPDLRGVAENRSKTADRPAPRRC